MSSAAAQLASGLHRGTSFADYCIDPGINASTLKLFTGRTPKHAKHDMDSADDDSASLAIGHASHTAVLEPDLFDRLYAVYPKAEYVKLFGHPNSNKYKAARDEWLAEHEDRIIITDEQHEHARRIAEAVAGHPLASRLLMHNRGVNELTVIGEVDVNGQPMRTKARLDRVTEHEKFPALVDLKTIATRGGILDGRNVSFAITNYKYHQQAAWYLDRLGDHKPADRLFIFVFVENTPPYDVACYMLEPESIEQGRRDNERSLKQYATGMRDGRWPGFSQQLQSVNIRDYAIQEGIDE